MIFQALSKTPPTPKSSEFIPTQERYQTEMEGLQHYTDCGCSGDNFDSSFLLALEKM